MSPQLFLKTNKNEYNVRRRTITTTTELKHHDGNNEHFDVIIIGAGWAGLGAANTLLQKGNTNFRVLEARDYVGGRSKTIHPFDTTLPVDLGSEWVQGIKNNPIHDLVIRYNIPHAIEKYEMEIYTNCKKMDRVTSQKSRASMLQRFTKYQEHRQEKDDRDKNLKDVMNDFKQQQNQDFDERFFDAVYIDEVEADYGCDSSDLSLYWWDDDSEYNGGDAFLGVPGGGYSKLIDQYSQHVVKFIQLQSKVTAIDYNSIPVKVTYEGQDGVTSTEYANKVLVTLPIGVLRQGHVNFNPALPKRKQKAINHIGPGTVVKVILYWENLTKDNIFWPKDCSDILFVASTPSLQGRFTSWSSAYSVNGVPILKCFLNGAHAICANSKPERIVVAEAVEVLRENFGHENVPDPTDFIVTSWLRDEFTLGAYSYVQVNASKNARKHLFEAVDDRLYFAGEATSTSYPGSTHGALQSGIDAANNM